MKPFIWLSLAMEAISGRQTSSEKQEEEVEAKVGRKEEIKPEQPKEEVEEQEEASRGMHR